MGGYAWVTLATNNSYSLGALVLAHSLKKANTAHKLVVLITPAVSQPMREQLQTVFDLVKVVDVLDSKDEAHLALMKRPDLGITFTKIHCWRLVEFEKCVFLDADTLVVRNCDELFEKEEFSAAPDVSWPDCFNSGVFVYRPSVETFNKLLQFAVENRSFDGGDQGLLNQFFSDWATEDIKKHLPFVYNLTSIAAYSYIPAFKHYGSETRIVHFIGSGKPWLQQLDATTRTVTPTSGSEHLAPLLQQWWDLFCEKVHPGLDKSLESSNDGMSHPPVEVRSNFLPIELTDEPETGLLVEPCTPYREKDDFRQHNLPYLPFHVKGPSGELLNVEFFLASVVPPEEPEVRIDEQERRNGDKMEEKFNSSQRENKEESNIYPNWEGHIFQGHETKEQEKNCEVEEMQQHYHQQQQHSHQNNQEQQSPQYEQHQQQHHHHEYEQQDEQNQQQHHHHEYQQKDEQHQQEQKQEEPPPPKDPFDYNSFFPDETCINNYLENNVVTYQPFDSHHQHNTNGDAESKQSSPPLPRFLTIPQNDQRQSGNIEMQPREGQYGNEPPADRHYHEHKEPTPPREATPRREPTPPRQPTPPREPTPPRQPTPPREDCQAEAFVEKRELSKSKSMSCFPNDIAKEVAGTSPKRSIWKSQPDLNVDPNRRYSMPKLKPILPKQRSFSKSVPSEIPKITQYTEFLISKEYKDPVGLPKDKIGFVETHIHKVANLRRSKSDADIRDKFGPLPYVASPEVEKPVIPKRIPQWHFDNENYDLSKCKRQMGNKPKPKDADERKEIIHSFPALKPIIPAKDKKSTLIKKRKSKELSPGDGGKEKIPKREPKKARERKRESLITPRNVSTNGNGNNLDDILKRLREFSKDYQHFFGVVPDPKGKAVTCKNTTVQDSEQDGAECGSSETFETLSTSMSTRSKETQTQKRAEGLEFRNFRNYVKDQKETSQKGLLGIQDILSESKGGEILKVSVVGDHKEYNGRVDLSETKDKADSMAEHSTQEHYFRENSSTEIGDQGISTQVKALEKQQIESLNPEVTIPTASDRETESSPQASDDTLRSIAKEVEPNEFKKISDAETSTHFEELQSKVTEKTPNVCLKDRMGNSDEGPTGSRNLAEGEKTAEISPSSTLVSTSEESNGVDSKSRKVVKLKQTIEKGLICDIHPDGEINEINREIKEVSESVVNSNYLTSQAQKEHLNLTGKQEKDIEGQSTKRNAANHGMIIETGIADSNGEDHSIKSYDEEVNTGMSSPITSHKKPHMNGLPKTEGPRDVGKSPKAESDSKEDGAVRTKEKTVQNGAEDGKKPEEVLCVPDFETPRSSRVTPPRAKAATGMTSTREESEKLRRLASQKPTLSAGKPHQNGQMNGFDTHSNDSPDGAEGFVGKRKPASPAPCTPPCGNAQIESLEELKSASGIAGAIAQLNLEEGGQKRSDSAVASTAHEEYLRRQNWETGNMDYMGRDSFDNIWTKICQTIEAKDLEQTAAGSPQPPTAVTCATENEKKSEDSSAAAAPLENSVALSTILQPCPEYIDILPGGEPVVGPVEDDEIIFTKPENRQSCLPNITEEEETGREDSATGPVKLSDILQPAAGSEETKTPDGGEAEKNVKSEAPVGGEAPSKPQPGTIVDLQPLVGQDKVPPESPKPQPLGAGDKTTSEPSKPQSAATVEQQPVGGQDKTPSEPPKPQSAATVEQQPVGGQDKTPSEPPKPQSAATVEQQPVGGQDKTPSEPPKPQSAATVEQQPVGGQDKTPSEPPKPQSAATVEQQQPVGGQDKTPSEPPKPQSAATVEQQPVEGQDKVPSEPPTPAALAEQQHLGESKALSEPPKPQIVAAVEPQSQAGQNQASSEPPKPQPVTTVEQQSVEGERKAPAEPSKPQPAAPVEPQPAGGENKVPAEPPKPAENVKPEPEKPECEIPGAASPPPPTSADELQKKPDAKPEQDSDKKPEECKTVAIPSPPIFFPGVPFSDKDKTQCKDKTVEEKPEVKSEPIPLPPPETPAPQEQPTKSSRSDSLKEEGKQKKGVFSKILEMVGVTPKEKNGGEASKSVFYDIEEAVQPKQESEGKQIPEIKEKGKPVDGKPAAIVEVKHSEAIDQTAPQVAKAEAEIPEKVEEKKAPPPEGIKAEELPTSKPEVKSETVAESPAESKESEQQKTPDADAKKDSDEAKPGQSPIPEPKGNSLATDMKQLGDSIQVSPTRKSPSPKLKMPSELPQTEVTVPTPSSQPEVPPRKNSALLKVDDTILETPPVVQSPNQEAEETIKRKLSTEIEDIIGKAKSEVESLLEDQRSAEKEAGESSDLINTMKLMMGGEQPTRPPPEEVEELRVTTEEERRRHKGEVVTSKLSDQILRAIPPPRRKAISEASASTSGIPKSTAGPEQKSPPGESKPKTSKPSSIPVPPPRNRGKPTTPDPSKAKGKK